MMMLNAASRARARACSRWTAAAAEVRLWMDLSGQWSMAELLGGSGACRTAMMITKCRGERALAGFDSGLGRRFRHGAGKDDVSGSDRCLEQQK